MKKAKSSLQDSIYQHLTFSLAKRWEDSNGRDKFRALALTVRDRLVGRMLATERKYQRADSKRLYYLSIEFLIGRSLANNLHNIGLYEACREAIEEMGLELDQILEQENDAALGNRKSSPPIKRSPWNWCGSMPNSAARSRPRPWPGLSSSGSPTMP
jgi:glycogen phosphorylase